MLLINIKQHTGNRIILILLALPMSWCCWACNVNFRFVFTPGYSEWNVNEFQFGTLHTQTSHRLTLPNWKKYKSLYNSM